MQGLISNLIRPFRFKYSVFDLGPKFTDRYEREDSSVLNDRGFRIQYSYYKNKTSSDTCLVYAHCNSGCRIQGLQFVQATMEYGWNLCLFDFVGSGISEGEYISLGYFECMDLQAIISVMLKQGNNKINLWGRSMGAATIIMYLSQTKQIDTIVSCVLDSPYCSLWKVVKQFGRSKTKIPEFIVEHVMEYIRRSILKDHQFDIKQMDLLKKVHNIDIPMMFIASTSDSFVNCSHASELYKWAGSKQKVLEYIQKQHNSPRQLNIIEIGLTFLSKSLIQKQQKRKQLRILSKKKQLCRKMTGNNMAELITKPIKRANKTQALSTGNLARFSSFCINPSKQKTQQHSQTKIKQKSKQVKQQNPKAKNNDSHTHHTHHALINKNKNPHTIQQSIIKLALPPKQVLQQLKSTKYDKINAVNMNDTRYIQSQINVYSNDKINMDKQNNLNICNKNRKEDEDEIYPRINSEIKNFSSIITKRFHFDANKADDMLHDPKMRLFQKQQTKDRKSKTQKISKLYVKEHIHPDESPTRIKPNGIKLFKKINDERIMNQNRQREKQRYGTKQRIKTEIVQTLNKQSDSSEDQPSNRVSFNQQMRRPKELYNSYSQASVQQKQRSSNLNRWCGKDLCKAADLQDITKQTYVNQYMNEQYSQITKQKVRGRGRDLSYNQVWDSTNSKDIQPMSEKMKLELKHFNSIGDLPSNTQFNGIRQALNNKQGQSIEKTQKIIKIQLDRNLLRGQKQNQWPDGANICHKSNINLNINVNLNINKNEIRYKDRERNCSTNISYIGKPSNNIEMNPMIAKFKMKNRKLLKINCNQGSSHSLL